MDAKEKSFYTAVLIISIVLGIIIIYFIISIIRQQRRSLQLYRKSILTEITTLEKERSRIASDLHDEVGPVLSAIKFRVGSFELQDAEDHIEAEKTLNQIDGLIQRMREISFNLMPATLIRKGLVVALREFIEYCSRHDDSLKIFFRYEELLTLNEEQSVNLYRIAQEVIHNAIKHSRATQLKLELRRDKNKIVFATSDNGIGFNYDNKLSETSGYGLRNLLNRTEIMGGQMFIESKKGKGTTYIFEIPVNDD